MAEPRQCPKCSAELPPDAPQGVCPKCLLDLGLGSQPDATAPYSSRFDPPPVEDLAEHFPQLEVIELIGVGGMGAVYKARQPGLDRLVALKILPPEVGRDAAFAERFAREARALARLSHPNIVAIHDSGQANGFYYFVMEYVEGADLRQTIASGQLEAEQALAIVPQICEALQFAHDEGIVHRDIKPENVLLDQKGRVKIADFGLAKLLGKDSADFTLTGTGQAMGTPHYMAPEQMEKPLQVDHRADIYSLGVVFYEMLTGELPIGRFAPPSKKVQVDVRLDEVVLRALEKEPELRYQSVSQIQTDVASVRTVREPPAQPAAGPSVGPSVRTRLLVMSVVSAMIAAFHVGGRDALARAGVSLIILWLLVVLLVVVPSIVAARYFRDSRPGPYLRFSAFFLGAMMVFYPLIYLMMDIVTDPQPALDWLYGVTGATPGEYDAAVIGALRTAGWVVFLVICAYGYWVLFRIERDRRRERRAVSTDPGGSRRGVRLLLKLAVWTGVLGGVWALLMPVIWTDWWPTIYKEHFEVGLKPQSGAYRVVKLRAQRRLYCWGQHVDRPMVKKEWIAIATIDLAEPKAVATMEFDPFLELWQWAPPVGTSTASHDVLRPQHVADWMKAAGIDTRKPGVQEEAAELIRLLKDAAKGVAPGGNEPRAAGSTAGTKIGPYTCTGGSSWGYVWEEGAVVFHLVAAGLFLAIWSPVVLIMVRRHRRRLAAAREKDSKQPYHEAGQVKTDIESISDRGSSSLRTPSPPTETLSVLGGDAGSPSAPRFSRKAIWAAVWAAFFFLAIVPSVFVTERGSRPTMHISESSSSSPGGQTEPIAEPVDHGPQWWQWVLMFTLLPAGATAPFGTTILGAVSIGEIRHSGGRLIGLPLALADALLFPLLVLDALICFACYYPVATNRFIDEFVPIALIVGLMICLVVDFLIVLRSWRRAARDPRAEQV